MPDISMCSGKNCLMKETCYRYNAKPSEFMQTYFCEPPLKEDKTCDYYWENKNSDAKLRELKDKLDKI